MKILVRVGLILIAFTFIFLASNNRGGEVAEAADFIIGDTVEVFGTGASGLRVRGRKHRRPASQRQAQRRVRQRNPRRA